MQRTAGGADLYYFLKYSTRFVVSVLICRRSHETNYWDGGCCERRLVSIASCDTLRGVGDEMRRSPGGTTPHGSRCAPPGEGTPSPRRCPTAPRGISQRVGDGRGGRQGLGGATRHQPPWITTSSLPENGRRWQDGRAVGGFKSAAAVGDRVQRGLRGCALAWGSGGRQD